MPGRIDQNSSAGCHQLIRDGATLLTNIDDLLSELNYLNGLRPAPIGEKPADVAAGKPANLTVDEALNCRASGDTLSATGPRMNIIQTIAIGLSLAVLVNCATANGARPVPIRSLATTFPFTSSTLSMERGVLYGVASRSQSPVIIDP